MTDFEPRIVAFVCNWCAYGGADQAGGQKLAYPANVQLVRVMCSGRVSPRLVLEAFRMGADGVMVLGCHPGDCHYRNGNLKAEKRFKTFKKVLAQLGIEEARCLRDWVAASEGKKFQELAVAMTRTIKRLGPLRLTAKPGPGGGT
ncbi:MAG: hydrogenase iron-sulfur subunit [candidate division FCPU426 bacterium]